MKKTEKIKNLIYEINAQYGNLIYVDDAEKYQMDRQAITKLDRKLVEKLLDIINIGSEIESKSELIRQLINREIEEERIDGIIRKMGIEEHLEFKVILLDGRSRENADAVMAYFKALKLEEIIFARESVNRVVLCYPYREKMEHTLPEYIYENITTELMLKIEMGIGCQSFMRDIEKSYSEAKEALELAQKFDLVKPIHKYEQMMVYRIISHISAIDRDIIMHKVQDRKIELLETEEIRTANVFLECNLNVSEAARKLFIHRNTLIYRLEKIQKVTGYDLKVFKDALEFRIILLTWALSK